MEECGGGEAIDDAPPPRIGVVMAASGRPKIARGALVDILAMARPASMR